MLLYQDNDLINVKIVNHRVFFLLLFFLYHLDSTACFYCLNMSMFVFSITAKPFNHGLYNFGMIPHATIWKRVKFWNIFFFLVITFFKFVFNFFPVGPKLEYKLWKIQRGYEVNSFRSKTNTAKKKNENKYFCN